MNVIHLLFEETKTMQPDRSTPQTVSRTVAYDAGLRAHFQRVYNTMAAGLGVTGVIAYAVANIPALNQMIFGTPLAWIAAFAPLAFCFFGFNPKSVMTKSAA